MGLPDIENIPETGAVFTIGRSRFADNVASHFFIRKDPVVSITCGDEHSAVVCQSGRLFVFGSNDWGQLGLGHKNHVSKPSCVKILKPEKVTHVACGRAHTLICTGGQKIFACGSDQEGQLGRGSSAVGDSSSSPVLVYDCGLAGPRIVQIAAGSHHSMALTSDGGVVAWGSNLEGQLGLSGISGLVNKPTKVPLPEPVKQISTGYYHSAFLTESGLVYVCGESESGKLGIDVNFSTQVAPKQMQLASPAAHVECGGHHTFILAENGNLYCAGSNVSGQLGMGSNVTEIQTPKLLPRGPLQDETIAKIACGESHTTVLTESGKLFTCGDGRHGKLGLEENENNVHEFTYAVKYEELFVSDVSCGGCHTILVGRRRETNNQTETDSDKKKNSLPPLKLPVNRLQNESHSEKTDETEKTNLDNETNHSEAISPQSIRENSIENNIEDPEECMRNSMNNMEKPSQPEQIKYEEVKREESATTEQDENKNLHPENDNENKDSHPENNNEEEPAQNNVEKMDETDSSTETRPSSSKNEEMTEKKSESENNNEKTSPEKKMSPGPTPPPKPPRLKPGSAGSSLNDSMKSPTKMISNVKEAVASKVGNILQAGADTAESIKDEISHEVENVKHEVENVKHEVEEFGKGVTLERILNSASSQKSKTGTEKTIEADAQNTKEETQEKPEEEKHEEKTADETTPDDADVIQSPAPRTGKMAKLFRSKRHQEMENGTKTSNGVNSKNKSKTCTIL